MENWNELTADEKANSLKISIEHWSKNLGKQLDDIRRANDKRDERIAALERRLTALEGRKG